MLEAEGIAAKVFNENAQGGVGELPFTHTYPELWVEDHEFQRGRDIVYRFEHSEVAVGTLQCANCGEQNPATFDFCWNCNRSLP